MNIRKHQLPTGIGRRDLMVATIGAGALAVGISAVALAQTQQPQSVEPTVPPGPGKVRVEQRGPVLLIGIERPQAQNLLDAPVLLGIGKAYFQLEHDDGLRVAVLHGLGADFSIGVDLASLAAAQAAGTFPPKDPDFINAFGLRPPYRSKPVVVAVQGGVKFGAHELFLASDIRVAATDTRFSQGEVTRGVFPGGGATVRLVREIGWANAMRYMLTGEEWGADDARRLGLVQEVTPPNQQLDRAVEFAQKIAAAAPLGVRAALTSSRQALSGDEALFPPLTAELLRLNQSEDRKEFLRAVREGRAPVFRGI
jgi:enoyl-CoA hydratase/carnithine racemase